MPTIHAEERYLTKTGLLRPVKRFGDLLKVDYSGQNAWEIGQEIRLFDDSGHSTFTRVVHIHGHFLYLYLRASGSIRTERRNLPRLNTEIVGTIQISETISVHISGINWNGFTLIVHNESDRLKMKLYKSNSLLLCQLDHFPFEAEVHFLHGKSIQTKVGVIITSISEEHFEQLSQFIANHSIDANDLDHPARWVEHYIE